MYNTYLKIIKVIIEIKNCVFTIFRYEILKSKYCNIFCNLLHFVLNSKLMIRKYKIIDDANPIIVIAIWCRESTDE